MDACSQDLGSQDKKGKDTNSTLANVTLLPLLFRFPSVNSSVDATPESSQTFN